MGQYATQVKGDERSEQLAAKNEKEIMPFPDEITEWANENLVYIFNVSPYTHLIDHPSIGRLTIPACKPGARHSEPAVLKGMVPYGVCVEMKTVEIRHDSGRVMACDLLGIGAFKSKANSLLYAGVFIGAEDTFDVKDLVAVKVATGRNQKPVYMELPRWVKAGKSSDKPTDREIELANEMFAQHDFALVAEADDLWNEGPLSQKYITKSHREALRRRGQLREWDKPLQSYTDCPGCGEKVKPGIKKHVACGWRFDLGSFEGEKKSEQPKRA